MGIDAASHAYQLHQLANGKAEQTAELHIKEASKKKKTPANLQFATGPVWAQNPDSQPSKVYPSHN